MYLTGDLKNILRKKDSGEYVPEYFELVKAELKARGEDPEKIEEERVELKIKNAGQLDTLSGLVSGSLVEKLNLVNLELKDLVQLYVWESKSAYFMSLVESELRRRGEDVKQYVQPGLPAEEATADERKVSCSVCGKELAAPDNFCPACGNPKQAENI